MLLLARDESVIAAAQAAARCLHVPSPVLVGSVEGALARLAGPGAGPRGVICEAPLAAMSLDRLLSAADEDSDAGVVLVGEVAPALPARVLHSAPEAQSLAATLQRAMRRSPAAAADRKSLQAGIRGGEITLRYQPVVRLADRHLVMFEALARWDHAGRLIGPDSFVPLSERHGLARELAAAVLARLTRDMAVLRWHGVPVAVNLPLSLLLRFDLPHWLRRHMHRPASRPGILLELTESERVRDMARLRLALERAGQAGFPVLLDDIAPLEDRRALLDLPFAGVKLDRGLVEALPGSAPARSFARSVVREAHRRGMSVTAEGVANAALWQAVAALGVDQAQGWAVGRALPAGALASWATAWRAQPPQARR